jgi:hypothetical protein
MGNSIQMPFGKNNHFSTVKMWIYREASAGPKDTS